MANGITGRTVWGLVIVGLAFSLVGWILAGRFSAWGSRPASTPAHDSAGQIVSPMGRGMAPVEVQRADRRGQARPYLGITYVPVNPQVAPRYGLDIDWGALVTAVTKGSPADSAGIRVGDVVLFFEEQALSPDVSLLDLLWHRRLGATVRLVVWRDGRHFTTEAVLETR